MIHRYLPNFNTRPLGEPLRPPPAPSRQQVKRWQEIVDEIVRAFSMGGYKRGFEVARSYGPVWESAAHEYVATRAYTEPQLAQRVAELRALRIRTVNVAPDMRLELLEARLQQVRDAGARSHTPDAAVADLPDVPRGGLPEWASWAALAIAGTGLLLSLRKSP